MFGFKKRVHIKLNEEDFAALVRGGELIIETDPQVRMILADIGFDRMREALKNALVGNNIGQAHTKKDNGLRG